jgi:hypothetical protein
MWLTGIIGNIIAPSENCGYAGAYLFGEIHPDFGRNSPILIHPTTQAEMLGPAVIKREYI